MIAAMSYVPNPLIRKLTIANTLSVADQAHLGHLCSQSRVVDAHRDIVSQGNRPHDVHLVLDGIVIRYKLMPQGKRQIVAVLLPGDFCDLHAAILGGADDAVATVTPCTIADIPAAAIRDLTENHPRIIRAFWWAALVDEATLREWLVNLGQREALERTAHFFCEMLLRLQAVGLADGSAFPFPFTQDQLADLLCLTSVHVNRTLQTMRADGLISLRKRMLHILDEDRLKKCCDFDPAYLHLEPRQS